MIEIGNSRPTQIEKALELAARFGWTVPADAALEDLFGRFRDLIDETDAAMKDSGAAAACAACASATGSCCFPEMEQGYGALSLYVNLLMGSDISAAAYFPGGCRFAGEHGCRLKARHSFCLNYFCPGLKESIGRAGLEEILRSIGRQLLAGWELERALARWTADWRK
jgi:hypothetical protein